MRYFFGILVTIGLIVLIIVLLAAGGGSKAPAVKAVDLRSYANSDARAQLIVDGPTISDQEHQQVEIDVDHNQVSFTIYRGYQRTIQSSQTFPNNDKAFNSFLYGLYQSNFAHGDTDASQRDNRGYCVAGERYNFSFDQDGQNLIYFWRTSCGQGTYKGNFDTTLYLFENQVPNLGQLTSNLNFAL